MAEDDLYKQAYEREKEARKQMEALLETKTRDLYLSNQQLQEANQTLKAQQRNMVKTEKMAAIGVLSAGVAHEVNNPLSFIKSNLNSLQNYYQSYYRKLLTTMAETENGQAVLDQIFVDQDINFIENDTALIFEEVTEGIQRVGTIVAKLKNFSRTHSGDFEAANINKLIKNSLTITKNELKHKCEVVLELGDTPDIMCNPNELTQVFINLVLNASQAIRKQGTITVRSWFEANSEQVCMTVSDTGCGIPEEHLDQIFTPFFTAKPIGEGTGLGLSVSYGLIEDLGGTITVASELNEGTTFTVRLPLDRE
ncbi:two-component sensor histidine kinase [bacterium SCSIO 12696]|nr:two-component sensor histidine kinase [bacterium SCSIO 12696]